MDGIYIVGAGGYARSVYDLLLARGEACAGVVVEAGGRAPWFPGPTISEDELLAGSGGADVVVAVGDNHARAGIVSRYGTRRPGLRYPVLTHPRAHVSPLAALGEGCVVLAFCAVGPLARLGRHCSLYTGAIVEHDAVLEDFVSLAPAAALGGAVKVGEGSFIGINAAVSHRVKIGRNVVVGGGSTVIGDLPDDVTAVGSPARAVKARRAGDGYL